MVKIKRVKAYKILRIIPSIALLFNKNKSILLLLIVLLLLLKLQVGEAKNKTGTDQT